MPDLMASNVALMLASILAITYIMVSCTDTGHPDALSSLVYPVAPMAMSDYDSSGGIIVILTLEVSLASIALPLFPIASSSSASSRS